MEAAGVTNTYLISIHHIPPSFNSISVIVFTHEPPEQTFATSCIVLEHTPPCGCRRCL